MAPDERHPQTNHIYHTDTRRATPVRSLDASTTPAMMGHRGRHPTSEVSVGSPKQGGRASTFPRVHAKLRHLDTLRQKLNNPN